VGFGVSKGGTMGQAKARAMEIVERWAKVMWLVGPAALLLLALWGDARWAKAQEVPTVAQVQRLEKVAAQHVTKEELKQAVEALEVAMNRGFGEVACLIKNGHWLNGVCLSSKTP